MRKKGDKQQINRFPLQANYSLSFTATEFRITVDPNGRLAESPTAHCAPDLSRTPRKNLRRRTIVLRAPSQELKAVWQNLLQRQMYESSDIMSADYASLLSQNSV